MPEKIAVNSKFVFVVAGGIAAAAIIIFVVMGSGLFSLGSQDGQVAQSQPVELQLSLVDITAEKTDERTADVNVAFNVHNPNRNTAILETIHYTVFIDELKMTSGDIGVSPEGFVASQEGIFPIVSNTTVTLKDSQASERNNLTAEAWDSMVTGDAQYRIEGTIAYKLTGTSFQFSAGEKDFLLMYP
jgi:LEA14-like dessication related protein